MSTIDDFSVCCTGDVVVGDTILYTEGVFGGSLRKPKHLGDRQVVAKVIRDSYGKGKQQHTFTLQIIWSEGIQALEVGATTLRKGRNVYRNGTFRLLWDNETKRERLCEEKHQRGDVARQAREQRRDMR